MKDVNQEIIKGTFFLYLLQRKRRILIQFKKSIDSLEPYFYFNLVTISTFLLTVKSVFTSPIYEAPVINYIIAEYTHPQFSICPPFTNTI